MYFLASNGERLLITAPDNTIYAVPPEGLRAVWARGDHIKLRTLYVQGVQGVEKVCFSRDNVRPDPWAANPPSLTCGVCPMNAWGSAVGPTGKTKKACNEYRMEYVYLMDMGVPCGIRIPPGSLKLIMEYERLLQTHGENVTTVVTQITWNFQLRRFEFAYIGRADDALVGVASNQPDPQWPGEVAISDISSAAAFGFAPIS